MRDRPPGRGPDRLWLLTAGAVVALLVLPLCLVEVPPVLDYPNHLARIFVLAHPDDPVLSQMYRPAWHILPNLGMDIIGAGLLKVTSVHVGGRLLLALSLLAPVLGIVLYSRAAFGRWSYWPLASGLIAYNGIFFLGFMNFLLSLGIAFAAAGCWLAQRRNGDGWRAAAVAAIMTVLIFFSHLFGVILFAILIGSQEASRLLALKRGGVRMRRDLLHTAALLAVALLPAVALYLAGPLSDNAAEPGAWLGWRKFLTAFTPVMTTSLELTLCSGLLLLIPLALCWRTPLLARGSVIAMLVLAALFVASPTAIKGGSFVDIRMPMMMACLLFAGMQPRFGRDKVGVAVVLVAGLMVVRTAYVASTFIDHRRDLADLRAAIAPLQPLSRVLVARRLSGIQLQRDVPSRVLPGMHRLDGHIAALLLIERKAFWPLMFADPSQQPLAVRPPYDRLAQPLAEPALWSVLGLDPVPQSELAFARYLPEWRSKFDHVLLIDPVPGLDVPHGLAPVVSTAFANLYAVTPPL